MSISIPCHCSSLTESKATKDLDFAVFDAIDKVPALQWDKFIPQSNVLMQHESLKLVERVQGSTMEFRYVLVKREGILVGAIYFQLVTFHANQLINYFPEGADTSMLLNVVKKISERLLNLINLKLLVSGNVFMTGENGFYFSSELDMASRAEILRNTIKGLLRSNPDIQATLVSDLYNPKSDFDEGFTANGFHEITVESDMSLALLSEWKSFDDYLQSLSSKYRVRAKKVFELCDKSGVEMRDLSADEILHHQDAIYSLYNNVMANADFKLAELSKDFFAAQKKNMPNNYKLFAYFKNDELIGFISAFCFGKRMEIHYTGMNHTVSKPIHLYQHMMYDMVKLGIEMGAERLHFGRTAPEIKSTIGATPSPMYGYVKHFNPVFNFLFVKNYTANLKPKKYVIRSPFK